MSDFVNSQKIVYELKPSSQRRVPLPPDGFKEAKQLNDLELTKVDDIPFLRLLGGKEPLKNVKMRYDLYKKNWNRQLQAINAVLLKTDRFKFRSLREFISLESQIKFDDRLTTGFLNLGSNISNHDRLLSNVCRYLREDDNICLVRINPLVCSNIQKVMKRIEDSVAYKLQTYDSQYNLKKRSKNKTGSNKRRFVPTYETEGVQLEEYKIDVNQYDSDNELKEGSDDDDDDDDEHIDFEMQLNQFDLLPKFIEKEFFEDTEDMLLKFKEKNIKLVVLIQNADSMSSSLIEQCLGLFHKYNTISEVCCFIGISTPFIIFQEKISKLLIRKLKTKSFAIDNSNEAINQIMEDLLLNINETYNSLIFDPKLVLKFLYKRDVMSIQQFNNNMKMIYMRHYYSQPLSLFWTNDFSKIDLKSIYFTIFKTLPSVIENSKEIDQKHLIGIADNNVQLIGDMLRTNLNKLINWRYDFRNLIDFLNFIQASILQESKIWSNNLELFQMLFEMYYELRDAEDNWNDIDDDERDDDSNIDDLIEDSKKKSKVEKKLSNALMSRINPVTLTKFLNPIWKALQNMERSEIKSFYKQLCSDEQFHFITHSDKFPKKCPYGSKNEFIKSIQISLRNRVCELDLDYQPFREICVVREDTIWKIHDAFEPCVRENNLRVLDDPGKVLFNNTHWVDNDDVKKIDVKMFHFVEPILCEMYRIFKETGVNTNVYDFYQVFQNSIMRRKEMVQLLNIKLDKLRENDDIDKNDFDSMKEILSTTESELNLGVEDEWSKLTLSWFLKSLAEFQIIGLLREGSNKSQAIEKVMWRGI